MLTLSFIHLLSQVYNIHNSLPGLLGYLILFATQAFVPQRQFIHKGLLSLLSVPLVSKNFISTPIVLIYTSHIKLQYICSLLGLDIPSRYPLNLIKMNNTSLPRIAATAGTRFGQDIQIENCHYQLSIQNFIRRSRYTYAWLGHTYAYIPPSCWFSRQAIDQYSSLLYYTYWGFFRPNVVDQPLSFDYGLKLVEQLPQLLLTRDSYKHLKAKIGFF